MEEQKDEGHQNQHEEQHLVNLAIMEVGEERGNGLGTEPANTAVVEGADGGAPIIDLRSPTVIDLRTPVFHHGIGGHGGHRGGGQEGRGGRVHVRRGGEGRGGRGGGRLGGRGRAAPNPVFILDEDEAVDDDRPIVLPPVAPVPEIVVMNFLVQPACNHAALPFQIAGPRAQRPGWAYVRCPYYSRCRFFRYLFCANCA